jgi:hypothetical protein
MTTVVTHDCSRPPAHQRPLCRPLATDGSDSHVTDRVRLSTVARTRLAVKVGFDVSPSSDVYLPPLRFRFRFRLSISTVCGGYISLGLRVSLACAMSLCAALLQQKMRRCGMAGSSL